MRVFGSCKVMATLMVVAAAATGCGGGGGDTTPVVPPAPGVATATVNVPATGKTPWNLATSAAFTLRDGSGTQVVGALVCTSDVPGALTVSADCSSLTGKRLGAQVVTVSSGSVTAKATVKVIPQAQPIGTHGPASPYGSGEINLVTTTDGRVLAWGANPGGALGQGMSVAQLASLSLPTAVKDPTGLSTLSNIVAASAGEKMGLALSEDGEVYSWGDNNDGVLGRTAINGDPLPGKVVSPTGGATLQHIVAVSAGASNAVALADDGTVYSWGYYSGQAGADPKPVPGQVAAVSGAGVLGNAVAVSAGWNWSAALLADGRIVTWGFGSDGRQGQPSATGLTAAPGYVVDASTGQPLTGVVALSAGYDFGMALNTGSQVFAWGNNAYGQVGQGVLNSEYHSAVLVHAGNGTGLLSGITMVAAGGNHALALDSAGQVYSWGYSQDGELGDGASHPRLNASALPAAVVGPTGLGQLNGVVALAAGYSHSMAFAGDGSLLIWGSGFRGDLGQGGIVQNNSYVPLTVLNEAGSASLSLGPLSYWPNLLQRAR